MKRTTLSVSCVLLGAALTPQLGFSQPSYTLVCRGGGEMAFTYTSSSDISQQPQIWITFAPGHQGVGAQWQNLGALQPGECSWLDRAVAPAEPRKIALLNIQFFFIRWQRDAITELDRDSFTALQDPGRYQAYDVYNNGKGYLVVTGIGQTR
jgi:hypothetical protein